MPDALLRWIVRRGVGPAAALGILLAAGSAHAVDLIEMEGGVRTGSDPIQVHIGGTDPAAVLYLMVDGLDVSEFAQIDGDVVTLLLSAPLSGGPHEVSLVRQLEDGSLLTEGAWSIEVQQTGRFDKLGLGMDITQNLWGRIQANDTRFTPEKVTGDGSAQVRAEVEKDGFYFSGQAPFLWDSLQENFLDENGTVGDWLLRAGYGGGYGSGELRLGHQQVGPPTLAMDAFNRRGVGLELRSERLRSEVTGFSLRGTPLIGFFEGIGLSQEDDRVSGVQVHSTPIQHEQAEIELTGVWLKGMAPDTGSPLSGTVGADSVVDGSAWGINGSAALLGRRLLASGGYAKSQWDLGLGDAVDDAWSLQVVLDPFPELYALEYPLSWQVNADASAIGTDFFSLANPSLLADRRTTAFRSQVSWAGLFLSAYGGRIEDNVNGIDELPTVRADATSIELSVTPADLLGGERRSVLRWLGMPTLFGSYRFDRVKPNEIPAGFPEPDRLTDTRTYSATGGLSFQYDQWSWSLGHNYIDTDDTSPEDFDTTVQQSEVRADGLIGPVALGGGVTFDWSRLSGLPNPRNLLVMFNVRTPVWPEHVYFSGDVTFNHDFDSNDTQKRYGIVANGSIDWTALEAAEWYPGIVLSFVGSYQGTTDVITPTSDRDAYQLYLRATLAWPVILGAL